MVLTDASRRPTALAHSRPLETGCQRTDEITIRRFDVALGRKRRRRQAAAGPQEQSCLPGAFKVPTETGGPPSGAERDAD